jgi:hypothetical protein
MIDFKNSTFAKLRPIDENVFASDIAPMFTSEEHIIAAYQGMRDGVVFTNKRIIAINVQGLSGKKRDFTSMPYNRIQVYSVETSGLLDNDTELDLWFSGLGHVRFEFIRSMNVADICRLISEKVL